MACPFMLYVERTDSLAAQFLAWPRPSVCALAQALASMTASFVFRQTSTSSAMSAFVRCPMPCSRPGAITSRRTLLP